MSIIFIGDCLKILETLSENFFDAIISDPPYELGLYEKKKKMG